MAHDDDDEDDPNADAYGDRDDYDPDDYEEEFAQDEDSTEDGWFTSLEHDEEHEADDDGEEGYGDSDEADGLEYDYSYFDDDTDETSTGDSPDEPDRPRDSWTRPTAQGDGLGSLPSTEGAIQFYFDLGGHHPYLLLTKKPGNVTNLIAHLREANYSPTIAGNSRRPASNGRQYAFYVRIGNTAGGVASMTKVLEPIGIVPEGVPTSTHSNHNRTTAQTAARPDTARVESLAKDVETARAERDEARRDIAHLRDRIGLLQREVASKKAEHLALESRLKELRNAHADQARHREELLTQQRDQTKSVEQLQENVAVLTADNHALREDLERLTLELDAKKEQLDATNSKLTTAENDFIALDDRFRELTQSYDALNRTCAKLTTMNTNLQQALDARKRDRQSPRRAHGALARYIVIQELCPTLSLERESITIVEHECEKFHPLFEKLFDLQRHRSIEQAKRVQSTEKWMEIHFSTGSSDDGRLYYRLAALSIKVLVSRKQDQRNDILWMQRN